MNNEKYVSGEITLSKAYIAKVWVNRVIAFVVFVSILLIGFMGFRFLKKDIVIAYGKKTYTYDPLLEEYAKEDLVLVSYKEDIEFIDRLNVLLAKGKENEEKMMLGKVEGLPFGIYGNKVLEANEYYIACIQGCEEEKIVKKDGIYGKVVEYENHTER